MVRERELGELKRLAANQVVLELGSALGASATAMAGVARQVHCVDHFRGDPHQGEGDYVHEFFYQMRNVPNVVVHVGSFCDVLPAFKSKFFGLVFLDGYHTYEQVVQDIHIAKRLVKPGGYFAFHDYGLTQSDFGVTPAVQEAFGMPHVVETLAVVDM